MCLSADGWGDSLVLTGVPLVRREPGRGPSVGYRLVRWANRRGFVSDRRLEAERRRRGSTDYRAAAGVMRDVLVMAVNETYEPEMARVEVPVSLVWGADDIEVPPVVAERAVALFTKSPPGLTIVDGVGHLVPTSAPDVLRAAIDAHLGPR